MRVVQTAMMCMAVLVAMVGQVKAGTITILANSTVDTWGVNGDYGQFFTVEPGDDILTDYTFTVGTVNSSTNPFPFVSQIYSWNGTTTIGAALFTSNIQYTTNVLTDYIFTPNISVSQGQQYIALVTVEPEGVSLGGSGGGMMAFRTGSNYFGGRFAFHHDGTWYPASNTADAAFTAHFASAPEPTSLAIWSLGLVGVSFVRLRRKLA